MLILGIDTSCDDTSASVVEDGTRILSNIVSTQHEIHRRYGGIVPELASRRHVEMILPVVEEAMKVAGVGFGDISAIAVCHGPGLIGSLLVGVCFAKSLTFVHRIPLVAVNHLEGHIFSIFLEESRPDYPFIALVVSGGHTNIYRVDAPGSYTELSRTRDDAAGEAFDKVAKLLGLGYPGGPAIERLAGDGDPEAIHFPRASLKGSLDFSFSGLKTAVLNYLKKTPDARKEDVAASFQAAVIDMLVDRTIQVAGIEGIREVSLSGGVSANTLLRKAIEQRCREAGIKPYLPSIHLCTDNAAMIASAGFYRFKMGDIADLSLNPKAYLPLGSANG
jgi:N6-L-threonylcarbamoyladenine synthase